MTPQEHEHAILRQEGEQAAVLQQTQMDDAQNQERLMEGYKQEHEAGMIDREQDHTRRMAGLQHVSSMSQIAAKPKPSVVAGRGNGRERNG